MTPQLRPGTPKPDPVLLDLMGRQRALLIESILTLTSEHAPDEAPNVALLEATKIALRERALTLIREWGTDHAWAIVAATEAVVMLTEATP